MHENWEMLAHAVILKAVEDYRAARKRLGRTSDPKGVQATIRELEGFFRSSYFSQLTDLDPEYLIEKLKEEAA